MKRLMILAGLLCCAGGIARANLYDIYYDGSALPEQESWQRQYGGGGAIRTIEPDPDDPNNHFYRIDSRQNMMIYDFSEMHRLINPQDPCEVFISDWRVRILGNLAYRDEGVSFARDGYGSLGFEYSLDRIYSSREVWQWPIAPGVFHTYHLESTDMITYRFWIDGEHVRDGAWDLNSLNQSFVNFGDVMQGGNTGSLADWDYFRFGVYVPEPGTASCVVLLIAWHVARRR